MSKSRFGGQRGIVIQKLTIYKYLAYSVSLSGCPHTLGHCVPLWPFMYFTTFKKWKLFYLNIWAYLISEQHILLRAFLIIPRKKLRYFIQFNFKIATKYWGNNNNKQNLQILYFTILQYIRDKCLTDFSPIFTLLPNNSDDNNQICTFIFCWRQRHNYISSTLLLVINMIPFSFQPSFHFLSFNYLSVIHLNICTLCTLHKWHQPKWSEWIY